MILEEQQENKKIKNNRRKIMLKTNNTNTKQKGEIKMKKCGICWNEFEGIGNNPHPIQTKNNFLCCDVCNANIVIPSRKSIEDAKEQLKIKKQENFYKSFIKQFQLERDKLIETIKEVVELSKSDEKYMKHIFSNDIEIKYIRETISLAMQNHLLEMSKHNELECFFTDNEREMIDSKMLDNIYDYKNEELNAS